MVTADRALCGQARRWWADSGGGQQQRRRPDSGAHQTRQVAHSTPNQAMSGEESMPPSVMQTMKEAKSRPSGGSLGATRSTVGTHMKTKLYLAPQQRTHGRSG